MRSHSEVPCFTVGAGVTFRSHAALCVHGSNAAALCLISLGVHGSHSKAPCCTLCFSIKYTEVGCIVVFRRRKRVDAVSTPAIAQLVEHLTVECCSYQMVPGSIPGGRILKGLGSCEQVVALSPCNVYDTLGEFDRNSLEAFRSLFNGTG